MNTMFAIVAVAAALLLAALLLTVALLAGCVLRVFGLLPGSPARTAAKAAQREQEQAGRSHKERSAVGSVIP